MHFAQNYSLIHRKSIKSIEFYNKFINYVATEFELYLQDAYSRKMVYYLKGQFSINLIIENEKEFIIKLKIESNSLNMGRKMEAKINSLLQYFNKYFKK